MAIDSEKLLKFIVSKYNEDLVATLNHNEFNLNEIAPNSRYNFAYEAIGTFIGNTLRFRLYFNLGNTEVLSKFKHNAVDDTDPAEDYAFVSRGTVNRFSVTTDGRATGRPTLLPVVPNRGTIDPTNACTIITCVLAAEQW